MLCARVGMLCTARMRSPAHTARGHPEWRVALEGMRTALSEAWADELTLPRRAPPSDAACETGSPRRWGGARTMPGASTRIRCGGTASPSGSSSLLGSPTRCRTVVAAWRPGRARLPRAARLMVTGDGGPEGPRQVRVGVGLSQSSVVLRDSWGAVDAAPGAPQGDGRAAWFLTRGTGGGGRGHPWVSVRRGGQPMGHGPRASGLYVVGPAAWRVASIPCPPPRRASTTLPGRRGGAHHAGEDSAGHLRGRTQARLASHVAGRTSALLRPRAPSRGGARVGAARLRPVLENTGKGCFPQRRKCARSPGRSRRRSGRSGRSSRRVAAAGRSRRRGETPRSRWGECLPLRGGASAPWSPHPARPAHL